MLSHSRTIVEVFKIINSIYSYWTLKHLSPIVRTLYDFAVKFLFFYFAKKRWRIFCRKCGFMIWHDGYIGDYKSVDALRYYISYFICNDWSYMYKKINLGAEHNDILFRIIISTSWPTFFLWILYHVSWCLIDFLCTQYIYLSKMVY